MISWFNAPNEGLSPGGQLTLKTLTATENKTYSEEGTAYTSVTVNVGGGGGSGDFKSAEVTTVIKSQKTSNIYGNITFWINVSPETDPITFHAQEYALFCEQYSSFKIPFKDEYELSVEYAMNDDESMETIDDIFINGTHYNTGSQVILSGDALVEIYLV